MTKISAVKDKGRNPVPVKWVFNGKEEAGGLICLKSIYVVRGYIQVPGFDFTESLYPVTLENSTRILIGLTLYYEDYEWIAELCDVEEALLHPNMEVKMYIESTEGIVDLGIITKEFLEEYSIFPGKLMYGNVDAALLLLRLLAKYLDNEYNLKMSRSDS